MSKIRKVVKETKQFVLAEQRRDHKKWYELRVNMWKFDEPTKKEIRAHFDPNKNKTFGDGTRWRFWQLDEAEQQFLYAVMRWGS